MTFEIVRDKKERAVPFVCREGHKIFMHSRFDAEKEGLRLFPADNGEKRLIISLGAGFLYHLNLVKKDKNGTIVVIEDEETSLALRKSARELALQPDETGIRRFSSEDMQGFFSLIEEQIVDSLDQNYPLKLLIRALPGYERLKPDFCSTIQDKCEQLLRRLTQDRAVINRFEKQWKYNYKRNLDFLYRFPDQTVIGFPKLEGKRVQIAAAGPSLDESIERIKENEAAGWITLSTDTALPSLLSVGVMPAYVITIDCQHYSLYHYKTLKKNINATQRKPPVLIKDCFSSPGLDRFFNLTHLIFPPHPAWIGDGQKNNGLCDFPLPAGFQSGKDLPFYNTGGNVTFSAISSMIASGAGEILLWGADYATKEGRCYSRENAYYNRFMKASNRLSTIENFFTSIAHDTGSKNLLHRYRLEMEREFGNFIVENREKVAGCYRFRITQ